MSKLILGGVIEHWGNSADPPFHDVNPKGLMVVIRGPFAEMDMDVAVDYEEVEGDWFEDLWGIRARDGVRLRCVLELLKGTQPDESPESD